MLRERGRTFLLLALAALKAANAQDKAALIIGSSYNSAGNNDVELFGCPGTSQTTLDLAPYPVGIQLAGGVWSEDGQSVVACGGLATGDGISDDCYELTERDGRWRKHSDLGQSLYAQLMVEVPRVGGAAADLSLVNLGYRETSQIYNEATGEWEPYEEISPNWVTTGCFLEHNGQIYNAKETIESLDPLTWTITSYGDVPDQLQSTGTCAILTDGGDDGLYFQDGYFFNLVQKTWKRVAPIPFSPVDSGAILLTTLNGSPIVFGAPICKENGLCDLKGIYQYNALDDKWESRGEMRYPRQTPLVLEVPVSFCDKAAVPIEETAALIIGGYKSDELPTVGRDYAQLFGCPGSGIIEVEPFPTLSRLSGGIYLSDEDKVLVCGGFACDDPPTADGCTISDQCFSWSPTDNAWTPEADMTANRVSTFLSRLPEKDGDPEELFTMAWGQGTVVDRYNETEGEWQIYQSLDSESWLSSRCVVEYDGKVYHMDNTVKELDPLTWTIQELIVSPTSLRDVERCALLEIDGQAGILVRDGYWFNLVSQKWRYHTSVPIPIVTDDVNSLFTFQGKPTIFGHPDCDDDARCLDNGILQYDLATDSWSMIGSLNYPTEQHEVVEVPISVCNNFKATPLDETSTKKAEHKGLEVRAVEFDTAALIIGGADNTLGPDERFVSYVELIGCPNHLNFELRQYPNGVQLSAGVWSPLRQEIISCGGYSCPEGQGSCRQQSKCYTIGNREAEWEPHSELANPAWTTIMAELPLEGGVSGIISLGFTAMTEIFEPFNNQWVPYKELPEVWSNLQCLIVHDNKVYHIRERIQVLDPVTWTISELGYLPDALQNPGRCAIAEINEVFGIMLRSGYWFNLDTEAWEKKSEPPTPPAAATPRGLKMKTFGGKPTLFGFPTCNKNGLCDYTSMIQYQPDEDKWVKIADMQRKRELMEVIEVDLSFCDSFNPTMDNTAALVFGGTDRVGEDNTIQGDAELYGCPGESGPLQLPNYPERIRLASGTYTHDKDQVVVCGGFTCDSGANCGISNQCYSWNPRDNEWTSHSQMLYSKWVHLTTEIPKTGAPNTDLQLSTVGFLQQVQSYDTFEGEWADHEPLPRRNWYSSGCLIQYKYMIYNIGIEVEVLDPVTWTIVKLADTPIALRGRARCASVTIDGQPGIMTSYGYWFNLISNRWESKTPPPKVRFEMEVNGMVTFQGKPTIFGSPDCDDNFNCPATEVVQYDPDTDTWGRIGQITRERDQRQVVEVPDYFCSELTGTATTEPPVPVTNTAALIIGGSTDGSGGTVTGGVELFGCPGMDSLDVSPFPGGIQRTAGLYSFEEDEVIVCGGFLCLEEDLCRMASTCYSLNSRDAEWQLHSDLALAKWAHLMVEVPRIDDNDKSWLVNLGYQRESEIYNPLNNQWETYEALVANWVSTDCLLQIGDYIYHVKNSVERLNPSDWTTEVVGLLPDNMEQPRQCGAVTVNGQEGIFIYSGFFFSLDTFQWVAKTPPPVYVTEQSLPTMTTFQGKPTIFGNPNCNDDTSCDFTTILQYQPNDDRWDDIGQMKKSRIAQLVVEVPIEFCEVAVSADPEHAMLLIGGTDPTEIDFNLKSETTLYGCPGSAPIEVAPFPTENRLASGLYTDNENQVIVCGGYYLNPEDVDDTGVDADCYSWRNDEWTYHSNMTKPRWAHFMVELPEINGTRSELNLVNLGYTPDTESFDPITGEWEEYELLYSNWLSTGCIIEIEGMIYHINSFVERLDPITWELDLLARVPDELIRPRNCAFVKTVNNQPGIYIRYGYIFNLVSRKFVPAAAPPVAPYVNRYNTLITYNSKPTIFGNPSCDEYGVCEDTAVIQYDAASDSWMEIDELLFSRRQSTLIPVPTEICDDFSPILPEEADTPATKLDPITEDTAFMVVGGISQAGSLSSVINNVELHGCPGQGAIELQPLPWKNQLASGVYTHDGDQVIVCGGYACNNEGFDCSVKAECFAWSPVDRAWMLHSTMNTPKWAHLMAEVPTVGGSEDELYLMNLGYTTMSEIYEGGSWRDHEELPDNWIGTNCFIQHDNMIYYFSDNVYGLDPLTWTVSVVAGVPENLVGRGKCSFLEINGSPGIFLRNGHWFSLADLHWEIKAPPPASAVAVGDATMATYGGKPTIFGSPRCDEDIVCEFKDVVQYQPTSDTWVTIGELKYSRRNTLSIEVPLSFCDYPVDPPLPESAALVIGGVERGASNPSIRKDAILYGCDSDPSGIVINSYPTGVRLMSGLYTHSEDKVIICGGFTDGVSDLCYSFSPEENVWSLHSQLPIRKWAHLMAELPIQGGSIDDLRLINLGYLKGTEVYDPNTGLWNDYLELPVRNWLSTGCLIQQDYKVYNLNRDIEVLDPITWKIENLGELPEALRNPGKCAHVHVDGQPGIMLSKGFWFNLESRAWSNVSPVPVRPAPVVTPANAMWSFAGKPTVFGSPVCTGAGDCLDSGVVQFDADTNTWNSLQDMTLSRRQHEVIEVPKSWCTRLGPIPDTTTQDPSLTTDASQTTTTNPNSSGSTTTTQKPPTDSTTPIEDTTTPVEDTTTKPPVDTTTKPPGVDTTTPSVPTEPSTTPGGGGNGGSSLALSLSVVAIVCSLQLLF